MRGGIGKDDSVEVRNEPQKIVFQAQITASSEALGERNMAKDGIKTGGRAYARKSSEGDKQETCTRGAGERLLCSEPIVSFIEENDVPLPPLEDFLVQGKSGFPSLNLLTVICR